MGDNEVLSSVEADILNTSRVITAGVRPDGSVYGEAQGLIAGKGGERATFKAQGVGLGLHIAQMTHLQVMKHQQPAATVHLRLLLLKSSNRRMLP